MQYYITKPNILTAYSRLIRVASKKVEILSIDLATWMPITYKSTKEILLRDATPIKESEIVNFKVLMELER